MLHATIFRCPTQSYGSFGPWGSLDPLKGTSFYQLWSLRSIVNRLGVYLAWFAIGTVDVAHGEWQEAVESLIEWIWPISVAISKRIVLVFNLTIKIWLESVFVWHVFLVIFALRAFLDLLWLAFWNSHQSVHPCIVFSLWWNKQDREWGHYDLSYAGSNFCSFWF